MSMDRRSFLTGVGALTLGHLLVACQSSNQAFQIRILKNSIPVQLVSKFKRSLQASSATAIRSFKITPEPKPEKLFTFLQDLKRQTDAARQSQEKKTWFLTGDRQPPAVPNLVTLGDYWLAKAIEQNLIQPLNAADWKLWDKIPPQWQALVRRNDRGQPDAQGKIWAAPYSWGTTVIAYRPDQFKTMGLTPPQDWSDLWRSDLKGHISLLDNAREVIGLTLKHLGQSYNTPNPSQIDGLKSQLQALNQQAKFYSSDHYLQPLILGDTWVAVGWSTDLVPLIQQDRAAHAEDQRKIAAVVPKSGTALWANVWVRPTTSSTADPDQGLEQWTDHLINQWIDFCWNPEIAAQLSLLTKATAANIFSVPANTLPPALQADPILLPSADRLSNSEFLAPLSQPALEEYSQLWREIRQPQGS